MKVEEIKKDLKTKVRNRQKLSKLLKKLLWIRQLVRMKNYPYNHIKKIQKCKFFS